ncbi:hypothetical protein HanHA300_Chr04g0152001 [Helianthus annuus]|uniref:Uncharacterized protein n=1 Tax=Helianthus annuus TaxID=4232 RepID=A0A251V2H1_HELAN|nr:hypothetical protein HanHA300_Chr04g0152001 [Helianthus annuus]KAJ0598397.1 hypothetical protein HanHA89_Chr04g0165361 [Helianthus annuus]KAJ0759006.1 hypothetical protein HanLR1_Chr04g0156711 [Helianthus annuus]KAJ0762655.1 hypothetical protein HanOQP8_Chr04g0163751 [Helianthus annuus]
MGSPIAFPAYTPYTLNLHLCSSLLKQILNSHKQIFFSTDQIKSNPYSISVIINLHLCSSSIKVTSDYTFICRLHRSSFVNTSTINPPTTAFNYPHLPCQLPSFIIRPLHHIYHQTFTSQQQNKITHHCCCLLLAAAGAIPEIESSAVWSCTL